MLTCARCGLCIVYCTIRRVVHVQSSDCFGGFCVPAPCHSAGKAACVPTSTCERSVAQGYSDSSSRSISLLCVFIGLLYHMSNQVYASAMLTRSASVPVLLSEFSLSPSCTSAPARLPAPASNQRHLHVNYCLRPHLLHLGSVTCATL